MWALEEDGGGEGKEIQICCVYVWLSVATDDETMGDVTVDFEEVDRPSFSSNLSYFGHMSCYALQIVHIYSTTHAKM